MSQVIVKPLGWIRTAAALVAAVMATVHLPTAQAGQRQSVEHVVVITEFKFVPATLRVHPGDTIKWINRDLAPHTATAKNKSWDTSRLNRGQSQTLRVERDMVTDYYCRFHPGMVAKIDIVIDE